MRADFSLLKKVLSLPTAPFHEEKVIAFVRDCCRRWKVPLRQDIYGNLKAVYKKGKGVKKVAFMAHMDHPGFEVVKSGKMPLVQLLGGVDPKQFLRARVLICENGSLVKGKVEKIFDKKKSQFWVKTKTPVSKNSFGYFDLPGAVVKKGLIFTKAIDNVASVAMLLNLLQSLVRLKKSAHVLCFFTRAEEVGFVGAVAAARNSLLSKKIPVIVMESSSALAGKVTIGSGPVLRVGDRTSVFSPEIDGWLKSVAQDLKKRDKKFQFQRGLLQGGTCEATVLVQEGYTAGGLALPLGNYHNIGPRGYAAEYISLQDYQNMLQWLLAIVFSPSRKSSAQAVRRRILRRFKKYEKRLLRVSS